LHWAIREEGHLVAQRTNRWKRRLDHKISRRRLLASSASIGAGAAAIAFTGCGSGGEERPQGTPSASPGAEGTPKRGGQLELYYASGWNIDPQQDFNMGANVARLVYSHMFYERMDTGETVLLAAKSLEQPDDLTYVFTLRDDIHFHDTPEIASRYPGLAGRLVTAEDVKYAITRMRDKLTGGAGRDYVVNRMASVETVDKLTLKIVNNAPFSWTLSPMSLGTGMICLIIPHEVVEKEGDLKSAAVGSGPYMLDYASQTQGARFVRNPNYFVPDEPFIDSIRYRIINDAETGEAAFRSGKIDSFIATTRPQADAIAGIPGTYQIKEADLRFALFGVNTRKPPWNDERVVKALHFAIDRDFMMLALEGGRSGEDPEGYGKWCGALPWGLEAYSLSQDELHELCAPHDVGNAKALLSAAGYESIDVTLRHISTVPRQAALAEMIATQLREAGINAKLDPMDIPTFISKVPLQFDFEMNSRYNIAFLSPEQPLRMFLSTGGQGAGSEWGLSYPDVDAAFDDIGRTFDAEERREKVKEMQRLILSKHGPCIFLYAPYMYTQYRDFVKGLQVGTGQAALVNYRIWLDKAKEA
jgi:peptide/nickel transport system substrate-binding protein